VLLCLQSIVQRRGREMETDRGMSFRAGAPGSRSRHQQDRKFQHTKGELDEEHSDKVALAVEAYCGSRCELTRDRGMREQLRQVQRYHLGGSWGHDYLGDRNNHCDDRDNHGAGRHVGRRNDDGCGSDELGQDHQGRYREPGFRTGALP